MSGRMYNFFIGLFIILIALVSILCFYKFRADIKAVDTSFEVSVKNIVFKDEIGEVYIKSEKVADYIVNYKNGNLSSNATNYSGNDIIVLFNALKSGNEEIEIKTNNARKVINVKICDKLNASDKTIKLEVNKVENLNFDLESDCLQEYSFKIENPDIAILENGQIKALKNGQTNLVITRNDEMYVYKIEVGKEEIPVTSIAFDKSSYDVKKGNSIVTDVSITPKNATDKTFDCISSDTSIATVEVTSKGCKINGVKKGDVTVTVTSKNDKKATCKVTVEDVTLITSIKLNKSSLKLTKGSSETIKATLTPSNATEEITWSSSDEKIAKVDKNGKVTALKAGKATITVKSASGKKATCEVTVEDGIMVTSIKLNKTSLEIIYGSTNKLIATITPSNATEGITWSSSNEKIVTVNKNGEITTVAAGVAKITVKSASGKTAECTVTVKPYVEDRGTFPYIYRDGTADLKIERKFYNSTLTGKNTRYYLAHLVLKDYSRLHTGLVSTTREANGKYAGGLVSKAASEVGAIFAVEGDYTANTAKGTVHAGVYYNYKSSVNPSSIKATACYGYYNKYTGVLGNCKNLKSANMAKAISSKELTDIFRFGGNLVVDRQNQFTKDATQRPRQANFVGYVKPGEFYFVVSEGLAYSNANLPSDGSSYGLTRWEKANLLINLGCSFGTQLDGGASIIVWFMGKKLNSAYEIKSERDWLTDFVYLK